MNRNGFIAFVTCGLAFDLHDRFAIFNVACLFSSPTLIDFTSEVSNGPPKERGDRERANERIVVSAGIR